MVDIEQYMDLFCHRRDVFAEQQSTGQYFPVRRELTEDDVAEHLAGYASYGTYVIDPGGVEQIAPDDWDVRPANTVKYIVWDLDTHDEEATEWLVSCCSRFALHAHLDDPDARDSLLLESSGNKGVHVWLFLSSPIPARQARAWVERDFMPDWKFKAADAGWPLEVFPKQDAVEEGGFGNLVKLPFGVHAVTGNKSEVILTQGWANSVSEVVPLDAALVPPAPDGVATPRPDGRGSVETARASGSHPSQGRGMATGQPSTPFPCVDLALYGPVGAGYRNRMMTQLALYLYGHGIAEDLAVEQCLRASENYDPPLPEREVRSCVKSAYRGRQRGAGCKQDWLQDICPGPCDQVKVVSSPNALYRAQPGFTVNVDVLDRTYTDGKVRLKLGHPDSDNSPTMVVSNPNDE